MTGRRRMLLACSLGLLVCPSGLAAGGDGPASVLYVDDDAPPGGNGSSWDAAFMFVQDALSAANGPTEIRVAGGVYQPDRSTANPTGTGDRLATFLLVDHVALVGGYAGLALDDPNARDTRDPDLYPSILSGDLLGNDNGAPMPGSSSRADNAYHVIESWNNTDATLVDGFVISGGHANRPFSQNWWPARRDDSAGGALLVESDAVFRACTFTRNYGSADASVFVALSGPFAGVEAGAGAVMIAGGSPVFERCVFDDNAANRFGGALTIHRTGAQIRSCRLANNTIGGSGFTDSSFGAGIGDSSLGGTGRARVESCTIVNNTAHGAGGGGAVFTIFSDSIYANCVLLANHADGGGGGVLADNIANVAFHNCAIVGNTSTTRAAGVYEFSKVGDTYAFINTVVWGNRSQESLAPLNENMVSESGNFALYDTIVERAFEHPVAAFDISRVLDADPVFADPVGPDGIAYSGDEDLRAGPGSAMIDNGASFRVPPWLTTDLDAKPRRIDAAWVPDTGVGPAPIVDIGPYEAGPMCSPADLAEPFGALNFFDIAAYIALFNTGDPGADLATPFGTLNFFDVAEYIAQYNQGCP